MFGLEAVAAGAVERPPAGYAGHVAINRGRTGAVADSMLVAHGPQEVVGREDPQLLQLHVQIDQITMLSAYRDPLSDRHIALPSAALSS